MKIELCITGGIACGKSLVGELLTEAGFTIVDADVVCHDLMRVGLPVWRSIIEEFGMEITDKDGAIQRTALGAIVFADPRRLAQLNALTHPPARAEIRRRRHACKGNFAAIIPLIYEVGWTEDWNKIICVAAPRVLQIERMQQRGLNQSAIQDRLKAQLPLTEKMRLADYVIYNNGSQPHLRRQIDLLLAR